MFHAMFNHGFWGFNGMGLGEDFSFCKPLKFKDQNATNYYKKRCIQNISRLFGFGESNNNMVYNFLDQTVIMGFGMGDLKSKLDLS
jgi:hypothetical protein